MNFLEMSVSAGIMIVAIIILRALLLNKIPKTTFLILWSVVMLRLVFPFNINIDFGTNAFLMQQPVPVFTVDAQMVLNNHIPEIVQNNSQAIYHTTTSNLVENHIGNLNTILQNENGTSGLNINWIFIIWVVGVIVFALIFIIGYIKSYQKFRTAIILKNDFIEDWCSRNLLKRKYKIMISDEITTPFTVGILKPKIILAKNVDFKDFQSLEYILAHELYHIKRFDAFWKLIALLIACFHWFNPLVWIAFVFVNRDLEISCDAQVIKFFGKRVKKSYAYTLITMAESQNKMTPLFSGFSRNCAHERVKSIMKMRKTTSLGLFIAIGLTVTLTINAFALPDYTYVPNNNVDGYAFLNVFEVKSYNETEEEVNYITYDEVYLVETNDVLEFDEYYPFDEKRVDFVIEWDGLIYPTSSPIIPYNNNHATEFLLPTHYGSDFFSPVRLVEFQIGFANEEASTFFSGDLGNRHLFEGFYMPKLSDDYLSHESLSILVASYLHTNHGLDIDGKFIDTWITRDFMSNDFNTDEISIKNPIWIAMVLSDDFSANPSGVPLNEQILYVIQVCARTGEIISLHDTSINGFLQG